MRKQFEEGDYVSIRFCLWDSWIEITSVNQTIFGKRYVGFVRWADVYTEVISFRRWRIKAWL